MRLLTFFRKRKEQRAASFARKLVKVLNDLELLNPKDKESALIMIWLFGDGYEFDCKNSIEYNGEQGKKSIKF